MGLLGLHIVKTTGGLLSAHRWSRRVLGPLDRVKAEGRQRTIQKIQRGGTPRV